MRNPDTPTHKLVKPNGELEEYSSVKLIAFLKKLSYNLSSLLDLVMVEEKISKGISNNMSMEQFNRYLAETLAYMNINHPDYSILSARVIVYTLHK